MNPSKVFQIIFLAVVAGPIHAQAQDILSAMVADSATMLPLYNVNVRVSRTGEIAVSDIRGYFQLQAYPADTVTLSMVGYHPRSLSAAHLKELGIVFLGEETTTLNPVVILSEQQIPWLPKLPPENPWQNPTQSKAFRETPGFHGVQTFGPGYVLKGPISRFSKYEKERKKLKAAQHENYKAKGYIETVNNPAVKGRIMKDYDLTEDEYYRLLAVFNEKNKDIIYELEPNELISLLLIFYAEKSTKK